jgi:hypothetical protein
MKFYILEPEVAGGFGKNTIIDNSVFPPIIHKLNYQLDGWLGDDLLESFPCYIVTEGIKEMLELIQPSGFIFSDVEITKSDQFRELYPNRKIPKFYWLKIHGKAGYDDFGISDENTLVVSEKVLELLKKFKIDNCDIEKY